VVTVDVVTVVSKSGKELVTIAKVDKASDEPGKSILVTNDIERGKVVPATVYDDTDISATLCNIITQTFQSFFECSYR